MDCQGVDVRSAEKAVTGVRFRLSRFCQRQQRSGAGGPPRADPGRPARVRHQLSGISPYMLG